MIKRADKGIAIICDICGDKVIKKLTGRELLKMNAKLPDGWTLWLGKIYCKKYECQGKIGATQRRMDNSRKISQDNWTGTR